MDNLLQWITNETRKQPLWYNFSPEKSFTLGNYLKSGQNIVLFTPKTILRENNIEYLAFKQAFYAYKNCNQNPSINLIIKNIPIIQNGKYWKNIQKNKFKIFCFPENIKYLNHLEKTCVDSYNFENRWLNLETKVDYSCPVKSASGKSVENNSTVSTERDCGSEAVYKKKVDKSSPDQILKQTHEKQCKYFFESQKYMQSWNPQESDIQKFNKRNFCNSNLTLSFHIIDGLENYDFIRKIIPSFNSTTTDFKVFIIDSDNERSFALTKEATFSNLMEFINNFYSKTLDRLQRTTFVDVKKKQPFISFEELTAQSFADVTNREHENVSVKKIE